MQTKCRGRFGELERSFNSRMSAMCIVQQNDIVRFMPFVPHKVTKHAVHNVKHQRRLN